MAYAANRSDLEALHARLSDLAEQSGIVTTRAEYDSIKALYDSTLAEYILLSETYGNVRMARNVSSHLYDVPNFKDKNQWMAGGTLRNQTFAGGSMFSTDTIPSFENEAVKGSFSTALLTGNIVSMLNEGFTEVQSQAFGGVLDLIADFDVRTTSVVVYQFMVTMSDGQEFSLQAGSYTGDGSGGSDTGVVTTSGPMSLDAIREAYENRTNLANITPISFGIKITSDAFNGTLSMDSLASYVAGAVIGTVQSKVNSQVASMAVKALSITSIPATIGATLAVNFVLGELSEMALGIDNQFGYGGTYVGTDVHGKAHYAEIEGNFIERGVQHIKDQIGELMGAISGDGYASADEEATARALNLMRNAAIEAKNSPNSSISQKATQELVEIEASILQNMEDRGLLDRGGPLTEYTATEGEQRDSTDSGGFFSDVGDFFSDIGDFLSDLFDFSGDDDDSDSEDPLSTGDFRQIEQELGLDEVDDEENDEESNDDDNDEPGMGNPSGDGFSCFTAGTLVKVFTGDDIIIDIPIEDIVVGHRLVGQDMSVNTVLEYDHPLLGIRGVYKINDGEPFFTSEHPFLTTKGWKSVNPAATKADSTKIYYELNIDRKKSRLRRGDELVTLYGTEIIKSLYAVYAPPETQLYNFKLDGNNTYYANGYLVHNK